MVWPYLTGNWRELLNPPWLQIALALISVLCGAVIGAERERREKPAGLRTLILVCLGSTGFTLASFAFSTSTGDSGRVAAQIVTGIGFLGAGAILHGSGLIRGMTTAATIWATAAAGMVIGIGYAGAGLGLALLVRIVQSGALAWEIQALGAMKESCVELVFASNGGKTQIRIRKIMDDFHLHEPLNVSESAPDGTARALLQCRLPRRHHHEFLNEIALLPEIKEIKES